jgi:tetrahydromethanopterin S-methyltransferase subunit F
VPAVHLLQRAVGHAGAAGVHAGDVPLAEASDVPNARQLDRAVRRVRRRSRCLGRDQTVYPYFGALVPLFRGN